MNPVWLVAATLAAGWTIRAQECRTATREVTVYTLSGKTMIPADVFARAKYMAGKVLAGGGVTVKWAKGKRPADQTESFCGERLTIAFDARAAPGYSSTAMAYTRLNAGWSTEIHLFHDRMALFPDRARMPEFMGHVLAHEIVHVLQGVYRHSTDGLMKARWTDRDCSEMVRRPLPLAAEDVELIHARFRNRTLPGVAGAGPTRNEEKLK
jgi:hypothetical protein